MPKQIQHINCPFCKSDNSEFWAEERGWHTVRCKDCSYLYLCPRPNYESREKSIELGVYELEDNLDISERRIPRKVFLYKKMLKKIFSDVWSSNRPITWIDIGSGYGEMVEAVSSLAHKGSRVIGVEPMQPKVDEARSRGIDTIAGYIDENTPICEYASAINIFSHLYDFDDFLLKVRGILKDGGDFFIVTGDMSRVRKRVQFAGELGLPDHVSFASEIHLRGFLERNGFEIISVRLVKVDGFIFVIKNLIKRLLGRNVFLSIPYTTAYREIHIRARKKSNQNNPIL